MSWNSQGAIREMLSQKHKTFICFCWKKIGNKFTIQEYFFQQIVHVYLMFRPFAIFFLTPLLKMDCLVFVVTVCICVLTSLLNLSILRQVRPRLPSTLINYWNSGYPGSAKKRKKVGWIEVTLYITFSWISGCIQTGNIWLKPTRIRFPR